MQPYYIHTQTDGGIKVPIKKRILRPQSFFNHHHPLQRNKSAHMNWERKKRATLHLLLNTCILNTIYLFANFRTGLFV